MPAPAVDAGVLEHGGIQLAIDGERATITLNRPDVLNAQTPSTWRALRAVRDGLDPNVRVVVVRAAGRSFSAGLDRRMFTGEEVEGGSGLLSLATSAQEDAEAAIAGFQEAFTWLHDPARATVASVQGHAVGAGFQLALACDIRILADNAQLTMAETSLGLVPDLGGTLPLVRCVGYARAAEICLTGRRVSAEEASRIGLANAVVPAAELDTATDELVGHLLRAPAGAARETLALLAAAAEGPRLDEQIVAERSAQIRRLAEFRGRAARTDAGGETR